MRTDYTELGLRIDEAQGVPSSRWLTLIDRLLDLFVEGAVDSESLDTGAFREHVRDAREVLSSAEDVRSFLAACAVCLDLCETYQRRTRAYLSERESEYVDVIDVLRAALEAVSGGALAFEANFTASTERLERVARLEDIRELKSAVLREVEQLKATASLRRASDELAVKGLNERVETLEARLLKSQDEAAKDSLTGVGNRGALDRALRRHVADAGRGGRTFTLALIDLDDFKQINDGHGHLVGDRVLVCLAHVLTEAVRSTDLVARYGGDEFAVLLSGMALDAARRRLEEMRGNVAHSYHYEHAGQRTELRFTYSGGATEFTRGDSPDDVMARADQALYEAKRRGKNRLIVRRAPILRSFFRPRQAGAA